MKSKKQTVYFSQDKINKEGFELLEKIFKLWQENKITYSQYLNHDFTRSYGFTQLKNIQYGTSSYSKATTRDICYYVRDLKEKIEGMKNLVEEVK